MSTKAASKRAVCDNCHYPLKTCVCSALGKVHNNTRILILQDKNELKNAKNTARLAALSLSNVDIIQSDDEQKMAVLRKLCTTEPASIALIFPSGDSLGFETEYPNYIANRDSPQHEVRTLLFIDGTWRKAKRIYLSNEYLQGIPSFHFEHALHGNYRIRKTSVDNGLSTIEAVAYALGNIEDISIEPLVDVFEKMQSFWPHP
ncbi:tRNA-uridine aminocarboxypropyltransferase [Glaciecola sp. MF2-115]|uniref:tRNA-uridine aminocarboxypropyltransferase n=1 Tax=Glaciecola sp. MF2-115 TaxID=3384827 RepID=UPI0039A32FDC